MGLASSMPSPDGSRRRLGGVQVFGRYKSTAEGARVATPPGEHEAKRSHGVASHRRRSIEGGRARATRVPHKPALHGQRRLEDGLGRDVHHLSKQFPLRRRRVRALAGEQVPAVDIPGHAARNDGALLAFAMNA
ncbi:hypothetical protein EVAR_36858_1 [Eumeta japonica]|uniref:Uncharacterized protein n=1 Tax=Eumeta variegata TaxID=151549 RepID=A0A4C1WV39_EUMVA|nr:hypothetical protein EVAR_36858_1 [Eumeta japonica]